METNSSNHQRDDTRLLVMGYRGTLRPLQRQILPPALESLLEPWLEQALHLLHQSVPQHYRTFQREPVPLNSLLPYLKDRLIGILTQAVGAIGIASGEASATEITHEFPLLSSLIRSTVSEWAAFIVTFLQRLHRDQAWLSTALQCGQLPPIQFIGAAASDMHAGGHSVLRVCFRGGACLFYKPRPLTGEWLWHELLRTVARLDPQLTLPAARGFIRDADSRYGWAESIFPAERQFSDSSIEMGTGHLDYWHAAGATLCLAQHVRLTDLNLANIIATSDGPAVTDAECFATPNILQSSNDRCSNAHAVISEALDAILNTGLLPRKHDADLADVSGLFGRSAPVSGIRLPAWSVSPGGCYQLTSSGAELVDHGNAPAQTTPIAVLPQILDGYRHAAELLLRVRTTLLGPVSKWRAVLEKRHAPRFLLRDTLTYGCLLSRSLEPQLLGSSYRRRNLVLCDLRQSVGLTLPASVLRTELSAIFQLHIPRLTILPGSRTLATGSGRPIARRFTASTPAQSVVESIETLSSESIDNLHIPALLATML